MFDLLTQPYMRDPLITAVVVGSVCALLSVVVVLKRMAFIGQGISHAGFGAVGTAVFFGLGAGAGAASDIGPWAAWRADAGQEAVLFVFCIATAIAIGIIARRRRIETDSAIGILLVAAMAWGVIMDNLRVQLRDVPWYHHLFGTRFRPPGPESLLFGSLLSVSHAQMITAVILCGLVLLACIAFFKEIVFFTFDEPVSRVYGVPTTFIYYLLLVLLAIVIVLCIRVVGFLLVSALLVIPGATALLLSKRLGWVLLLAWGVGMLGVVGGLAVALTLQDFSPGACIVMVLCATFAVVFGGKSLGRRIT